MISRTKKGNTNQWIHHYNVLSVVGTLDGLALSGQASITGIALSNFKDWIFESTGEEVKLEFINIDLEGTRLPGGASDPPSSEEWWLANTAMLLVAASRPRVCS